MMHRFPLGRLVATPGALEIIKRLACFPFLELHASAEWGDVDDHDRQANDQALRDGTRLLSSYRTPLGTIWIITEADRSSTCILLPEEY